METKICKQCGEIKPLGQYRKYYGGRKGNYSTCKACEKINSREKYLQSKVAGGNPTDKEVEELQKIHQLWEYQMTLGLRPPRQIAGSAKPMDLDDMLELYGDRASKVVHVPVQGNNAPPLELIKWLVEELTEEPEHYQDDVYDELKEKYRPQVRIDPDTMMPIYDDTYKEILDKIAARFDEYEDTYYDKED